MDVVGSVSAVLTVAAAVTKLAKGLNEVRDRYNNVALTTTLVSSQLNSIRAALEAIADWRMTTQDTSRSSQQLDEDLAVSLNCCAILVTVIESKLGEAGYTPGIKQKIRHLWLEDTLKEYLSNLEGQVRSLQLWLTIFQWYVPYITVVIGLGQCSVPNPELVEAYICPRRQFVCLSLR
jgi:hypothetical protein